MAFRNTQKRIREIAGLQRARRLFSSNERRLTGEARQEGLQRANTLQRMTKKDIAKLSTKDLERMRKSYEREIKKMQKSKGANIELVNPNGVRMTNKTAKEYLDNIQRQNDQVAINRATYEDALRKGANVPEGVPTPQQVYYGHSELEFKQSYLDKFETQKGFERSFERGSKIDKSVIFETYFNNYKNAFVEQLNPTDEQRQEFEELMNKKGIVGFNKLYYSNEFSFNMDFIYDENLTNDKIEKILSHLR